MFFVDILLGFSTYTTCKQKTINILNIIYICIYISQKTKNKSETEMGNSKLFEFIRIFYCSEIT